MHSSLQIANELISRSAERNHPVSNLSLQKLAFFAHGWHLALTGEPLIDELFEAWRFGPVLPSLYHKFKGYSSNPIPKDHLFSKIIAPLEKDSDVSRLLDKILEIYGGFTGSQLVTLSHVADGPWAATWSDPTADVIIPNDKIREYFYSLADKKNA